MDMFGMGKEAKDAAEDTVERASKKRKKGTAEDTDKRASKKQKKGTAEGTAGGDKPQKKSAPKKRDKNAAQDTGNRSKPVAETRTSPAEVVIPQSPEHRREAPIGRVLVPGTLQHQRPPDGRPVQRQAHIPDEVMHAYRTLTNSDEAEPSNEEMMEFLVMMLLLQGHSSIPASWL